MPSRKNRLYPEIADSLPQSLFSKTLPSQFPDSKKLEKTCFVEIMEFYIPKRRGRDGYYTETRPADWPDDLLINTVISWVSDFDYWFIHEDESLKERPINHVMFSTSLEDHSNPDKINVLFGCFTPPWCPPNYLGDKLF